MPDSIGGSWPPWLIDILLDNIARLDDYGLEAAITALDPKDRVAPKSTPPGARKR